MVSFPRPGVDSTLVTIKGPKECVHGAKAKILEMVAELDAQVSRGKVTREGGRETDRDRQD